MHNFKVKGITVKEILSELASEFDRSVEENLTEFTLTIPDNLGKGKIQGINFPNGVGLLRIQGKLKAETNFEFTNKGVYPLKFIYCTKGSMAHTIKSGTKKRKIGQYQSAIISTYYNYGHTYHFPAKEEFSVQIVEVDRKKFKQHIDYKLEEIPYHFYKIFADVEGVNEIFYKSNYTLKLSGVLDEIRNFDGPPLARVNFMGAKALEMLSLMLTQYEDDIRDNNGSHILRKSELGIIAKVAKHIEENLANPETIEELSRKFGLSKMKLQQGFQLKCNQTINEYLNNLRMEKAVDLLNEGEKNISEIVYALGLSSHSYFSKIFKEHFDISPRDYVKNKKKKQ